MNANRIGINRNSSLPKSREEDAVFAEHTDEYWEQSDQLEQQLLGQVFSREDADFSAMNDIVSRNRDFLNTIGVSKELLRIYVVSGITLLTVEAIRQGIPQEKVMEIRRRAFVSISETGTPTEWAQISGQVIHNLHDEYLALDHAEGKREHPLVRKACNYIYLHRQEAVSAADVAGFLGVDRTYLAKLFRTEKETTLTDYILSVKMKEAAEWLRSGKYTLSEIAAGLGFSSYAYFSRRFKDHYGVSPKHFV